MLDICSWNNPGHNAFMGDRPSAVSSYAIPESVKAKLKTKMLGLQYDDVVEITKHGIEGNDAYINMRNMHFGTGQICKTVDMSQWKSTDKEVGLVYCVDDTCVIVPTVCGNVSQIDKLPKRQALKQFPVTTDASESFELQATVPPVAFFSSVEKAEYGNNSQHSFRSGDWGIYSVPNLGEGGGVAYDRLSSVTWGSYWMPLPPPSYVPSNGTALDLVTPIPEPSTYLLTLLGIGMIGLYKWRNDKMCTLCGRVGHRAHACPWSKYKG